MLKTTKGAFMRYYSCIVTDKDLILSCDMIRLSFELNEYQTKQFNNYVNNLAIENSDYGFTMFESRSLFNYRYMLNFKKGESSFVVGLGFNAISKLDFNKCFIEFNPNKCLSNGYICPILNYLKSFTKYLELVRFDFAIDIPVVRSLVSLSKDKRDYNKIYRLEKTSINIENITEYLGKRNNNGFVKLYNKTIECNLDYALTRLEITLDSLDYKNFLSQFPLVYYNTNYNLMNYANLSATDKVLFSLLSENENKNLYLKMLGRDKQEKFKNMLFNTEKVTITENDFYSLIYKVREIYL